MQWVTTHLNILPPLYSYSYNDISILDVIWKVVEKVVLGSEHVGQFQRNISKITICRLEAIKQDGIDRRLCVTYILSNLYQTWCSV